MVRCVKVKLEDLRGYGGRLGPFGANRIRALMSDALNLAYKEVIDILKNRGLKVVKQTKKDYEKFDGKVNARQKFPKEMFALAPVGVASLMQEDLDGK